MVTLFFNVPTQHNKENETKNIFILNSWLPCFLINKFKKISAKPFLIKKFKKATVKTFLIKKLK